MSEKTLKTRIQNKRGTTAEWATGTAPNFVPKDGEIVAYTDVHRIKIGDGTTKVSALPFVDKVRDVTLGGESMVNANGVVELQQTEMTNNYIPVWDNTEKIFKDSVCTIYDYGFAVEGVVNAHSFEYSLEMAPQDAAFYYSEDGGGTSKKYALPITKNSGTLALTSDIPSASNFVTTNTNQTITGSKTFTGTLITEGVSAKFTNAVIGGDSGLILDCYELQGSSDSIFSVWAEGENKGKVFFGDGAVDVNINFGESYITSDMLLCPTGGKTAYPQTKATKSYVSIKTSASAGTFYYDGYIVRAHSNTSPSNINLPTSSGTLALTNQIPIKTATLSGTTLSITLG